MKFDAGPTPSGASDAGSGFPCSPGPASSSTELEQAKADLEQARREAARERVMRERLEARVRDMERDMAKAGVLIEYLIRQQAGEPVEPAGSAH